MAIEKRLIKFLFKVCQFHFVLNFAIEVNDIFNEVMYFRKLMSTNIYVGFYCQLDSFFQNFRETFCACFWILFFWIDFITNKIDEYR